MCNDSKKERCVCFGPNGDGTYYPMGYEFEHQEITKIVPITDAGNFDICTLSAGDDVTRPFRRFCNNAKLRIQLQPHAVTAIRKPLRLLELSIKASYSTPSE